jgi:Flp pilus assembly pilin Flp
MSLLRKLFADSTGTSAVEYGLICSLMVIGLVVGIQGLGASVVQSYDTTATAMHNATAG